MSTLSEKYRKISLSGYRMAAHVIAVVTLTVCILPSTSFSKCSVIEYPDRKEIICSSESAITESVLSKPSSVRDTGKREELRNKYQKLTDKISSLQRNLNRHQEYYNLNHYFTKSNVTGIIAEANHTDAANNKKLIVTISCDVTSVGSGEVLAVIEGKNFKGRVLKTVSLQGYVEAGQYARLHKTFDMSVQQFNDVRIWESERASITTKIAEKSDFDERTARTLLSSLILESEDLRKQLGDFESGVETATPNNSTSQVVSNQNYSFGAASDAIVFAASKMGKVSFPHKFHQDILSGCTSCHSNSSGGTIPGFGKDLAHKTCKACHAEMKKGPTACKDCHKK